MQTIEKPLHAGIAREMLSPGLGSRGLRPAISGAGQSLRFAHDGFNEGFESSFAAYVHEGRGAVVMTNSGDEDRVQLPIRARCADGTDSKYIGESWRPPNAVASPGAAATAVTVDGITP